MSYASIITGFLFILQQKPEMPTCCSSASARRSSIANLTSCTDVPCPWIVSSEGLYSLSLDPKSKHTSKFAL